MKIERIASHINFPVEVIEEDGHYIICTTEQSENYFGHIIASGKSKEEAERQFWAMAAVMKSYHWERASELDKWKPFQKGDWKHIGGKWITIFGINISFRYGKNMKYGWYIPFTKLNISICNYWTRPVKKI